MPDKKVIAVLGATGAQGGGLVRAVLADNNSEFSVRALTRDIDSEKAKELKSLGADVAFVDVDNYDSIKKAFAGAHGVYAVTFFWNHYSPEKEMEQSSLIAKAVKETNVKHVIWSTLEDTRNWIPLSDNRMPTLGGKYKVPHFDGKGESDKNFTDLDLPVTLMLTSFYWDNFVHFGMGPKRGADGKLAISLPMGDKKLAGIAAEDIGKCAFGVFKRGSEFIRKKIGISGGHPTGQMMAASLSKALGQEVVYNSISFDVYRGLGFPGAEDLGNMFQFYHDFDEYFCNFRSIEFSKSLNPELLSFDEWAEKNKSKIPPE